MTVDVTSLPVLPVRTGVVFPATVVTIGIETDEARAAVAAAEASKGRLLLVPRVEGDYASVGTVADIEHSESIRGMQTILIRGLARGRILHGQSGPGDSLWVEVEISEDPDEFDEDTRAKAREYKAVVSEVLQLKGMGPVAEGISGIHHPGQLADLAGNSPDLSNAQKVELLETIDVGDRLDKATHWMDAVLADLSLRRRIRDDATERIDKSQREYILRQQMEAIRKELGDESDLAGEYRSKLAEADLPQRVREAVEREIDRLERIGEQSPEHSWIRTWLDTVLELPWGKRTDDNLDLAQAREVLDADHTGLDDVKERIVEHLAVRKLRRDRGLEEVAEADRRAGGGAVVLLVGPPGVGKTSLGESVARALGREFVRVALGGVRDEAEVRGHRRTYVGARPGRIVRALTEAGTMNPVFLLDEMDKVGADWRGDPSSALLEVLDPAQNHTFRDHYLEMDVDLSQVLFIATANIIETIPAPLLDRMEVIRLDGYTADEKAVIAVDHLLPRQEGRAGLRPGEVEITAEALAYIIDRYTRESGVRGLERQLAKLVRKAATRIADAEDLVVVDVDLARQYLGKPTVHPEEIADRTAVPGVATGLAVTGAGGDVLFVEATVMEGDGGLTLTGQLGDVMKESAEIALSYVRSHAGELGIDPARLQRRYHLHVPAGAIPKDGPSAGITMTTALVSLLTGRMVREQIGMTGEVTLQGRVLPIGGVKQKVLAAHRAGLTEVVLPRRNADDLDDVPGSVREAMTFHLASGIDEVLEVALGEVPAEAAA
jgi:ATP-dependent Lon protease